MTETKEYLKYLAEEIHTTVFATTDSKGRPVTCAIDIMDWDETGLYFLTAKGKNFYDRLKANENVALTAGQGKSGRTCCRRFSRRIRTWRKFIPMSGRAAP